MQEKSSQGFRPWTSSECVDLFTLYGHKEDKWLASHFKRSVEEIAAQAIVMALRKDKGFNKHRQKGATYVPTAMPRWTKAQVATVRALYPNHSNLEIALNVGRSKKAVATLATRLKLSKSPRYLRQMGLQNVALRVRPPKQ